MQKFDDEFESKEEYLKTQFPNILNPRNDLKRHISQLGHAMKFQQLKLDNMKKHVAYLTQAVENQQEKFANEDRYNEIFLLVQEMRFQFRHVENATEHVNFITAEAIETFSRMSK